MEVQFSVNLGSANLAGGTFVTVPTGTGTVSAATLVSAQYSRNGNEVIVRGRINVTTNGAGAGTVVFPMSAPVPATASAVGSGAFTPGNAAFGVAIPLSFAAPGVFTASITATGAAGPAVCDFSGMFLVA